MSFDRYASYYDSLYQDKDYRVECDFLERMFREHSAQPVTSVLDMGCGTGGHAVILAQRGYDVVGVDRAAEMLGQARIKAEQAGSLAGSLRFQEADVRSLDLGRTFDAAVSMFAVMGYQTSNEDLAAAMLSARRHVRTGGLFVFDCWFGPAVLAQRPGDRHKVTTSDGERIVRLATSRLDIIRHVVDVDYLVMRLKGDRLTDETSETHGVRFFFPQELTHYAQSCGFRVITMFPFLNPEDSLSEATWNMGVVAVAE